MGQNATLKKISTQLNLSISTVSRALKDHPDISDQTKRKVQELAALMEYEPNSYAVNLRTKKSKVLGIIVPAISNMFYDSFIASVEEEARKSGYTLMILQSGDDPLQEAENLKLCRHYRVDGILISIAPESYSAEMFAKFREAGIPVIFFDKVPAGGHFDTVCMADDEAAVLAARAILQRDKKRILALMGNPRHSITHKRRDAFLDFFNKHRRPRAKVEIIYCSNSAGSQQAVDEAISGKTIPDHIFCMSDEILAGAMKALNHSTLKIPGDISILAISNGFIPGLFKPAITYIETSGYQLGKMAIQRMFGVLGGDKVPAAIVLPCRLVQGGSL